MSCLLTSVEIRNRIYDFAIEDCSLVGWRFGIPLLSRRCGLYRSRGKEKDWSRGSKDDSARKFFGLTQVCRQIRAEYRPLWTQKSSVCIHYHDVEVYFEVFHRTFTHFESGNDTPKNLWIYWDPIPPSAMNLTPLIRMRMARKDFNAAFVPWYFAGDWHNILKCWDADQPWLRQMGELGLQPMLPDVPSLNDFLAFNTRSEHDYVINLNYFLAHSNPKWYEEIRDKKVHRVDLFLGDLTIPEIDSLVCILLKGDRPAKFALSDESQMYLAHRGLNSWSNLPFQVCHYS